MDTIRDGFLAATEKLWHAAQGWFLISSIGKQTLEAFVEKNPVAKVVIGVGGPADATRKTEARDVRPILWDFVGNESRLRAMFLEQLVVEWDVFLNALFSHLLQIRLTGDRQFPGLENAVRRLCCPENRVTGPSENFEEQVVEAFSHLPAKERRDIVFMALEATPDSALLHSFKKVIVLRNSLQHAAGVVRRQDLKSLGRQSISVLDKTCEAKELTAGERVDVSVWEIKEGVDAFNGVARMLIPASTEGCTG